MVGGGGECSCGWKWCGETIFHRGPVGGGVHSRYLMTCTVRLRNHNIWKLNNERSVGMRKAKVFGVSLTTAFIGYAGAWLVSRLTQ